ncbi:MULTISPECIES: hypothetical protein [unclassified Nocardia]|uniref:hypothetical protein n=1 Tax=unclassified Nocardia TaxID=2637762 RepID=UPI001CE416A0|nr:MULTISPECIES: hypothetical protein [unclassified Nocardia]
MKYTLAGCALAAAIIGGMTTGVASAEPGLPLQPSEPATAKGQPVLSPFYPITGSAECWILHAPDQQCQSYVF